MTVEDGAIGVVAADEIDVGTVGFEAADPAVVDSTVVECTAEVGSGCDGDNALGNGESPIEVRSVSSRTNLTPAIAATARTTAAAAASATWRHGLRQRPLFGTTVTLDHSSPSQIRTSIDSRSASKAADASMPMCSGAVSIGSFIVVNFLCEQAAQVVAAAGKQGLGRVCRPPERACDFADWQSVDMV